MKIFSAAQIRRCEEATLQNDGITSVELMRRAADACAQHLMRNYPGLRTFYIFAGTGNNGGDGLATAEILTSHGFPCTVFTDGSSGRCSQEFKFYLARLRKNSRVRIAGFSQAESTVFKENALFIDALFGTGMNRKIEGHSAEMVRLLNNSASTTIAIDIPSGLFADHILPADFPVVRADETMSFQFYKKSFLHPETAVFCGKISILDIGLSTAFIAEEQTSFATESLRAVQKIYHPRLDFSHKGTYGKTLIVAGSYGKMGAAVLATMAALRAGSGITNILAPKCGYEILQTRCPEAMFVAGGSEEITEIMAAPDETVAIGPGLGTSELTRCALVKFLQSQDKAVILDADALNILDDPELLKLVPENSILTPHPKEFDRLFGTSENSFDRLDVAVTMAKEMNCIIVLKDHHTQIIFPNGNVTYNCTGNSGMAKGGSGDALLGILGALKAQRYSSEEAALLGVWLHGKAGDIAAEKYSKEAMLPTDLIMELGNAFKTLM